MKYQGERLVERDDDAPPRPRCRKCAAKLRAAPDCYDYDRSARRYALRPGTDEAEERSSGWTCGRCGHWHALEDVR